MFKYNLTHDVSNLNRNGQYVWRPEEEQVLMLFSANVAKFRKSEGEGEKNISESGSCRLHT